MTDFNTSPKRNRTVLLLGLALQSFAAQLLAGGDFVQTAQLQDYIRDEWDSSKGYSGGRIYGIGQTSDGYLWIGSERGLIRFDGLNFRTFSHIDAGTTRLSSVFALSGDTKGNLLVSLPALKKLRLTNNELMEISPVINQPRDPLAGIYQANSGSILIPTIRSGVFAYRDGTFKLLKGTPSDVISVAEGLDGELWMGTSNPALYIYRNGQTSKLLFGMPSMKINCMLPQKGNWLLLGTDSGLVRWKESAAPVLLSPRAKIGAMLEDSRSNLWLAGADGLYHIRAGSDPILQKMVRFSDGVVTALFEDREGDLWAGGAQGIARFKPRAFQTYDSPRTSSGGGPIFADSEDAVWFGAPDGGLIRFQNGRRERVNGGLGTDVAYSISGGPNELWIGRQKGGLTRLVFNGKAAQVKTFGRADRLPQRPVYTVHRNRNGIVWAGLLDGGLVRIENGRVAAYTNSDGLLSDNVTAIEEGVDGTMWFATPSGVSALSRGHWRSYTARDGLPPGRINCLLEDSSGILWVGADHGMSTIRLGQVHVPRQVPQPLREQIFGLALDQRGWLWISTSNHVLRVNRDALLSGIVGDNAAREYGPNDGLALTEGVKRSRSVIADNHGRIWLSLSTAISVVDPSRLPDSFASALVQIRDVTADGVRMDLGKDVTVPAGRLRVVFSFIGVSLAAPERVRYRYKLDGFDPSWSETTQTREAVYTNLDPKQYRFRVMASNAEGAWDGLEATAGLHIQAAVWQTLWFRLSALAMCGLAALVLYRFRLREVTHGLNLRFEERLYERARIARDLHDTLLQSFQGLILRFQAVENMLPGQPAKARAALETAIGRAAEALTEGRDAVQDLRTGPVSEDDLVKSLTIAGQELRTDFASSAVDQATTSFRVLVEGGPRFVHPTVRDDLYRIAREALRNAFRHAQASQIEIEIRYDSRMLRMRVRDDGTGMDPALLEHGHREGHWGLPGMRERARALGGQFTIWSKLRQGTEVEISIPSYIAYGVSKNSRAQGNT